VRRRGWKDAAIALFAVTLFAPGCSPREPRQERQTDRSTRATSPGATTTFVATGSDSGLQVDSLPPVVIETPRQDARVARQFEVAGTANVFEAVVGVRVRDGHGGVVVDTTALASCGTGCRGAWSVLLTVPDTLRGRLAIEAFAPSARDGSPLHLVHVRVVRE
jgi:Immunoglobulin-like domain of bacterial spore germination